MSDFEDIQSRFSARGGDKLTTLYVWLAAQKEYARIGGLPYLDMKKTQKVLQEAQEAGKRGEIAGWTESDSSLFAALERDYAKTPFTYAGKDAIIKAYCQMAEIGVDYFIAHQMIDIDGATQLVQKVLDQAPHVPGWRANDEVYLCQFLRRAFFHNLEYLIERTVYESESPCLFRMNQLIEKYAKNYRAPFKSQLKY
jgi:hypothetical protein